MREQFYIQSIQAIHARCQMFENKLASYTKILQEIVGKELMRGQALHKLLMDKGLFTDAELKVALEALITEAKADLAKAEEEVKGEKQKVVELLVPANAQLPVREPEPSVEALQNQTEVPNAESPVTDGSL